jgi:hypothetical protein
MIRDEIEKRVDNLVARETDKPMISYVRAASFLVNAIGTVYLEPGLRELNSGLVHFGVVS